MWWAGLQIALVGGGNSCLLMTELQRMFGCMQSKQTVDRKQDNTATSMLFLHQWQEGCEVQLRIPI
jgi:hypothetical protein